MKFAVEMRLPPTGLDTQVSVSVRSTSGRRSRSSKVSVISLSTMPWMRSRQSFAVWLGICRATSIR